MAGSVSRISEGHSRWTVVRFCWHHDAHRLAYELHCVCAASVDCHITFNEDQETATTDMKHINKEKQNGCRQRLEGYLSCHRRLMLAVA